MNLTYGLGRAIFGGFFLYNGIHHLQEAEALANYAAMKQIDHPHESVKLSGVVLIASGLSLIFGIKPRLGLLGIVGFLATATFKMHDFWQQQDPSQKQNDMIHFSKNMALLGAAMAIGASQPAGFDADSNSDSETGSCRQRPSN